MSSYLKLHFNGELKKRINKLYDLMSPCKLCPIECKARRFDDKRGVCGGGLNVSVDSWLLHFGEEPPISGVNGSGTIFFKGCTLGCIFCQNYQISRKNSITKETEITSEQLSDLMIDLQKKGAHNINLVTPDHFLPQIVEAIDLASNKGLNLPIVYNTSGFEKTEILKLLDGIIDIYMPDVKWLKPQSADFCTTKLIYSNVVKPAITEMWKQVGALQINEEGIAQRGLLIRHLVLPQNLSDSWEVLNFVEEFVRQGAGFSLMSQYYPPFDLPAPLDRTITPDEYYPLALELKLMKPKIVFIQELTSANNYNPDFSQKNDKIFR